MERKKFRKKINLTKRIWDMKLKITILYTLTLAILLCSIITESSFSQHIIGQETVNKVTQRVESGKKGRDASFMMKREDLKPGGFYLFKFSIRGDYKPELEVTFDKANYEEGDEITMTIERKTANRRVVTHPITGEKIDEGIAFDKIPVKINAPRGVEYQGAEPLDDKTIWLNEGESIIVKTIWIEGRSSNSYAITVFAGNIHFGESRRYVLVKKQQSDSVIVQRQ